MRATLLVSLAAVALPLAAQTPPSAPAPAAKRTVELTGLVLVNGFFTNARVNNSDVPQFVDSLAPASAVGGTVRQTRLGLLMTDPDVLHGSFAGEVDVDFFGGQQPSSGGRTFPLNASARSSTGPTLTRASAVTARDWNSVSAEASQPRWPPMAISLGSSVGPHASRTLACRYGRRLRSAESGCVVKSPCAVPDVGASTATCSARRKVYPCSRVARNCGSHSLRLPAAAKSGNPTEASERGLRSATSGDS